MKESRQAQATVTLSVKATELVRNHLIEKFGYYQYHLTKYVNDLVIKELDK